MKLFLKLFVIPIFILSTQFGFSQSEEEGGVTRGFVGFWEIETPTGNFLAKLDQITSISQHTYYIDGAMKVYECTVDTRGAMTARFYYIEPTGTNNSVISGSSTLNRVKDVASRVTAKAGMEDPDHIVTKNYPTTTHAKTAEYRFKSKDTIARIYAHARNVWAQQRGAGKANKITIVE